MGRCGRGPWVAPSPFTCKDMFASQGTAEMQDTGGRCQTAAALLCNMLVCLFPLVFCLHELPKPCWELISFRHPALEAWNCRMRADSVRLRPHNVHYACLSCFAYVLPTQIEKKRFLDTFVFHFLTPCVRFAHISGMSDQHRFS